MSLSHCGNGSLNCTNTRSLSGTGRAETARQITSPCRRNGQVSRHRMLDSWTESARFSKRGTMISTHQFYNSSKDGGDRASDHCMILFIFIPGLASRLRSGDRVLLSSNRTKLDHLISFDGGYIASSSYAQPRCTATYHTHKSTRRRRIISP